MRPAGLTLTACGIALILGGVLLASYLIPYRIRFAPSPPAVCTVNVWGSTIHQEPAEALVSLINREVPDTVIGGVPITYRLHFIRVESAGTLQARFVMRVHGTSQPARDAVGSGIAEYYKRVDGVLSARGMRQDAGYISDRPLLDKTSDTITWDRPLWLTIRR